MLAVGSFLFKFTPPGWSIDAFRNSEFLKSGLPPDHIRTEAERYVDDGERSARSASFTGWRRVVWLDRCDFPEDGEYPVQDF